MFKILVPEKNKFRILKQIKEISKSHRDFSDVTRLRYQLMHSLYGISRLCGEFPGQYNFGKISLDTQTIYKLYNFSILLNIENLGGQLYISFP